MFERQTDAFLVLGLEPPDSDPSQAEALDRATRNWEKAQVTVLAASMARTLAKALLEASEAVSQDGLVAYAFPNDNVWEED